MKKNVLQVSTDEEEMFTPKKYRVRPGTIDSGKLYEIKVTALLALKCCTEELKHFWLAANVHGFGALDDIIIFKKATKDDQGVTYLMQLKHQDVSKNIVKEMFLSPQGDFSLKKYSKCYAKIKDAIDDETGKADIIKHLQKNNKMVFIIFTNKGVTEDSQLLHEVNKTSQLNTFRVNGNMFEFNHEQFSGFNVNFQKSLFLFTSQPHIKEMDNEIQNAIKDLVRDLQLSDVELRDIAYKFVSFVGEWLTGLLNGHYPLTKTHILKKLTEIFLLPYIFKLQDPEDTKDAKPGNGEQNEEIIISEENIGNNERENIWYNLTRDKDITIIDDVDDVIQRFVNNTTYRILNNSSILDSVTGINKDLLRVVSNAKNISKNDKYELLWKTCKIPLLLQVSDSQSAKKIHSVLNLFPGVYLVIIFNKTTAHLENFQASTPFTNITDLNEEQQKQILQLPVKLQGRNLISIEMLNIDKEQFYKSLKVKDIVHILCGQFNIGHEFEQLPKFFVEMSLTRIILDFEVLEEAARDIFVVKCESFSDLKSFLTRQLTFSEDQLIQWKDLNKSDFESGIIMFNLTQNLHEIEEFCLSLIKDVHFVIWHGSDTLEWIKSYKKIGNLRKYERPSESTKIDAKEVLGNICQNIALLVSANPGMGKSVIINYFARNVPISLWVLKVNLPKHKDHYKNWDTQNCNSQETKNKFFKLFLKEVLNQQQIRNRIISDLVFEKYFNSKNLVLLLDGFDEVPIICQNGAKELIKFINQSGYHMCVTTRPVLKKDLESVLNSFAITLNSFTIDEQMYFLTNYFANIGNISPSDTNVISYATKLLKAARKNLNDTDNRFTGIPLQTKLIAEVFANDFLKYLKDEIFKNECFNLISLYKHYLNEKMKIAFNKVEGISEDMIHQYKTCRSFYALRHLFSDSILEELKIDDKLKTLTEIIPHLMHVIQKDGIIVTDSESNVSFVHQTYAEYLVANWLSENMNTPNKEVAQKIIKKTFEPNFVVVRNIFDRILARNCPLHTAIINRQINRVKQIIVSNKNALSTTDEGGRTVLHLIAAWGLHHSVSLKQFIRYHEVQSDEMMIVLKLIPNNKLANAEDDLLRYTPLDYAILSRSLSIADRICTTINNPNCYVNITKTEADGMLRYVDEYYSIPLYVVILRRQIATDFNLYFQNDEDASNLHKTIRKGNIQKVQSIVLKEDIGCLPLHIAANHGDTEIISYLLSRKAEINKQDNLGRTVLHWASYYGHLDIVSLLITNRVNVTITDCYNRTALHYAVISSSTNSGNIVSKLIKSNNINLTRTGNVSNNVCMKSTKVFTVTRKNPNFINMMDKHKMNALHWAAHNGQTDVISLLLTYGADIESQSKRKKTPLYVAALQGHKDVVSVLLANGADIEAEDEYGQTSLIMAARRGHKDVVSVLLTNGAYIQAADEYGQSPLHVASRRGHKNVVSVLLAKRADIEAEDEYGQTSLHVAAEFGHEHVVSMLLVNGADIEAKNEYGQTALHVAARRGHTDVVSVLLANGADIKVKKRYGETALHVAAGGGHKDVVSMLLAYGADIEAKDKYGRTPLEEAVCKGYKDVESILLTNEARGKNNRTPLYLNKCSFD